MSLIKFSLLKNVSNIHVIEASQQIHQKLLSPRHCQIIYLWQKSVLLGATALDSKVENCKCLYKDQVQNEK